MQYDRAGYCMVGRCIVCIVCSDGRLCVRALYCVLVWFTLCYGGVICGRALYFELWRCTVR